MECFENTTRITQEGYTAIVQLKRRNQRMACRAVSVVLAVPFLQRCVYYAIMLLTTDETSVLGLLDGIFALLLAVAVWLWMLPSRQVRAYVRRTCGQVDLQAVHQYTFLPDEIRMLSTSTMEKFSLSYGELSWVRSEKRYVVLCFQGRNFTMLVDKKGFTRGSAPAFLRFLRRKMDGMDGV